MESKRMRIARALDDFEGLLEKADVAWRVEKASGVQGIVRLRFDNVVEELAREHGISSDDIFGEASMMTIRALEDGARGRCDDYIVRPWVDGGKFIGHVLTFYKFGMIGGAA